jgi:hypothetical protein
MDDRIPAERDAALRTRLPIPVKKQPDPLLQLSTGRVGMGGIALFAVAIAVILGVVLYGLNGSNSGPGTQPAAPNAAVAGNSAAPAAAAPGQSNNPKS